MCSVGSRQRLPLVQSLPFSPLLGPDLHWPFTSPPPRTIPPLPLLSHAARRLAPPRSHSALPLTAPSFAPSFHHSALPHSSLLVTEAWPLSPGRAGWKAVRSPLRCTALQGKLKGTVLVLVLVTVLMLMNISTVTRKQTLKSARLSERSTTLTACTQERAFGCIPFLRVRARGRARTIFRTCFVKIVRARARFSDLTVPPAIFVWFRKPKSAFRMKISYLRLASLSFQYERKTRSGV